MSVIPVLIVIGLVVAGGFLAAFLWALNNGQFDDATTPAWRMLNEDTPDDGWLGPNTKSHLQPQADLPI